MEKMEDFWSTKIWGRKSLLDSLGHFSHFANSHSTLWRPKNPHPPCYWTPSEWFPSNLDWLTRHLLVSRRGPCGVPGDCIFVGSHDDSCMWSGLGTKGFVRIFPWGQHWQPEMDCPLITVERFTNGLFLFISEYFRGYQFVWKLLASGWPARGSTISLKKDDDRRRSRRPSVGDEFVCKTCRYLPFNHHVSIYIYTAFSVHVVPIISIISLMYYYIHIHILIHTH